MIARITCVVFWKTDDGDVNKKAVGTSFPISHICSLFCSDTRRVSLSTMMPRPRQAPFFVDIILLLSCLSLAAGYVGPGHDPLSFPSGKKNNAAPRTLPTSSVSTQLGPKTMRATGSSDLIVSLKNGRPQLAMNAELPVLHPRTLLPTMVSSPSSVSIGGSPPSRPVFGQASSKRFMTMGQVMVSNSSDDRKPKWLERLQKISNVASLLCVLDCTILPAVTILLPILGIAASPAQMEWIHGVGKDASIMFVAGPVMVKDRVQVMYCCMKKYHSLMYSCNLCVWLNLD